MHNEKPEESHGGCPQGFRHDNHSLWGVWFLAAHILGEHGPPNFVLVFTRVLDMDRDSEMQIDTSS